MARYTGRRQRAGTVALVSLVGTQLGQTVLAGGTSPTVLASTAASLGVLVVVVQTPGVSQFFGCTPLGPVGWTIGAGSALGATFANGALTKLVEHLPSARPDLGNAAEAPAPESDIPQSHIHTSES